MDLLEGRTSPRTLARVGGVLYLVIIVLGLLDEVAVRSRLVVGGDAAATARAIAASEPLWRAGVAGEIVLLLCAVALTLVFLVLLSPVSRALALLATLFNVVSIAIEGASALYLVSALFPLGSAGYLAALDPAQRAALAYLSIRAHGYGFGVSLVFFGCVCEVLGYLIFGSGFLPRALGVLMAVAGLCYLVNGFALILSAALAARLFPAILLPAFVGEASLCLWLLARGVDEERWRARASAALPPGFAADRGAQRP